MTEVASLASDTRKENLYDAELSYEERAKLRQKRRQESGRTQLSTSGDSQSSTSSYTCQSPTYHNHSSTSTTPSPVTMNGSLNGPFSPLLGPSSDGGLTASHLSSSSMVNGKDSSSSFHGTAEVHTSTKAQPTSNVNTTNQSDRQKHHSPGPLKSTSQYSESHRQPVAVGVASPPPSSSGQGLHRHRVNGGDQGTGNGLLSPRSSAMTSQASPRISGASEREQERETPTPTSSAYSKFQFPSLDTDDWSSRGTESALKSDKTSTQMKPRTPNDLSSSSIASTCSSLSDTSRTSKPKAFAEGLKFVDTPDFHDDDHDGHDIGPAPVAIPTKTTAVTSVGSSNSTTKPPPKTQIIFRPMIDEVHDEDITVISGCKFFDPSQSQADDYTPPPPLHQITSVSEGKTKEGEAGGKEKGKKLKAKSSIRQEKSSSSGKPSDGAAPAKAKVKDRSEIPKVDKKLTKKKKEEKTVKKSSPKKKRSISMSEADVGSGSMPSLNITSPSLPPLPSNSLRKGSASFRGDGRDRSLSPPRTGVTEGSMPDLTSPVRSGSRGNTPDSGTSEGEEHRRGSSLRNKLKSFMGRDKNNGGKTVRSSWRFSDLGGVAHSESDVAVALKGFKRLDEREEDENKDVATPTSNLTTTVSGSQLSLLTHKDRLTMLEDIEIVPRTYSMENIYPSYNEKCVDIPAIGQNIESFKAASAAKDQDSNSRSSGEYLTASESGSVTRLTCTMDPEKPEKEQKLSIPSNTSIANLSQESDKFLTPPEGTDPPSQSSLELSVVGVMDKALGLSGSVRGSKLPPTSKLASTSPRSSVRGSKAETSTAKASSSKGSPLLGRKGGSKLTTPLARKSSGTSSPLGSKKPSTGATSVRSPTASKKKISSSERLFSPKAGHASVTRAASAVTKSTTSPLTQRRVAASPGASPVASKKTASTKSTLSSTSSPFAGRRATSARVSTSSASPKSSPTVRRKLTPDSSVGSSALKRSPPKMAKAPLDSTAGQSSSRFSRFSAGRTPFKVRTVKENESTAEKVERIKARRRSQSDLQDMVSASCPNTPQLVGSGPRPKVTPPTDLNLSQPAKLESESPQTSGSTSPSTPRRRKLGVSMPASPVVEIPPTLREVRTPSPSGAPDQSASSEVVDVSSINLQPKSSAELEFDVDSLLSSVGEMLDEISGGGKATQQPLKKLEPVNIDSSATTTTTATTDTVTEGTTVPDIASMPVMVFTSPVHSREPSLDVEGERDLPTSTVNATTAASKDRTTQPMAGMSSKPPSSGKKSKGTTSAAPKSPSSLRKSVDTSATTSKKTTAAAKGIKGRLSAPSRSGGKDQLSPVLEKKETSSPNLQKKKTSAGSTATGKTETQPKFTSARPPRPPMMSRLPSDPSIHSVGSGSRLSSMASTTGTAGATSSTGQKRPRNIMTAGGKHPAVSVTVSSPPAPKSTSAVSLSSTTTGSESSKSKSSSSLSSGSSKSVLGRGGLRASGRTKKTSTAVAGTSQLHDAKPSQVAESSLRRTSIGRLSMKTKSSSRPGSSASTTSRRSSAAAGEIEKASSSRKSMRRVSSGEVLARKIKPGASATLTRDRRPSQASGSSGGSSIYASGRASTLTRPHTASNAGLSRTNVTRSMRISRGSAGRKSITTAPRAPMLTRKATPPPSGALLSPTRKNSLKRTGSGGEVLAAFDHISAQAQGSMLTGSDHRRKIRPRYRQQASTTHLKILGTREGVSTELPTDESPKLDPNTYSTYMAKKNLAPSAVAGLAAKLDFTTVKLRKTGVMDMVMAQQAGADISNSALSSPNPSAGNEHNTIHPFMLLKVKGRRHVQTRLVEPTGTSLNSGDVFIALTNNKLFHWIGKSANVIEKARGSDIVMRILHKKELGCCATSPAVLKEEDSSVNANTRKDNAFWELLGGKKAVKDPESVPGDEVYEKAVNMATIVYQLEGEGDKIQFIPIQENNAKMLQVSILHPKKILLFDFVNEVYVWIGKQSPPGLRRKAAALGKKVFEAGCRPPVFNIRSSPARQSGRYRPRTSSTGKNPRMSVLNASGRRTSRVTKSDIKPRPEWALFARTIEGAESILFREKFSDWPEPGRIIKMKGHVSSGEVLPSPPSVELQPADVDKMLKPVLAFEGLRLEGDNIHRGQGNFKVSRSTFACNRVRTNTVTKWVVKEFDNVEVPDKDIGVFYSSEAYVIRWGFRITVVRELEGLVPGEGMFARDRKYQRSLQAQQAGRSAAEPADDKDSKAKKRPKSSELSDSEQSDVDDDDECKRILESGGRDRCAYFFWQGDTCTVNEKGASALMTVELDKEKGPQVRVVQGKEPPAFLNLFNGSMVILKGRSETNSLENKERDCRTFYARFQEKSESCLVEITPDDENLPLSSFLRSRGCVVLYHITAKKLYLWLGSKATRSLKKSAYAASKSLRNRLVDVDLITLNEGEESNDFWNLTGDKKLYRSLASESKAYTYTPRLFELTSATGEFTANEVLFTARSDEAEAFPFQQSDIYSAIQPAMFLVDAHYEVYVWLGWWPDQKNKLLREVNATTGSAHARWLRDKKLALQTAQNYVKACNRIRTPRAYVVCAGMEHERFTDLFPFWEVNKSVQELNCKGVIRVVSRRVDVEDELLKYERTQFSLATLKERPLPEGVDAARLETYLSDEEFKKVFKMDKDQFSKLTGWKQTKAKKDAGLF